MPLPPLFKLTDGSGQEVLQDTVVGGEPAKVGALFSTRALAEEFSGNARDLGMSALSGLEPEELSGWDASLEARELSDWGSVEVYAASGHGYVLVVSERGTGLFHASDIAAHAAEGTGEIPFPLYILSDERGESPLISVQTGDEVAGEETLVAALFTSTGKARAFRDRASHLGLPDLLGTIDDRDGLRRHALVAGQAGAVYAVVDPESGLSEAIPIQELTL
jgi:hypothetical protein